ncbi:MAG TPA: cytochrome D ubiquinol oxidase subunit II [Planctomycetes bacterium]|nr:cytochrome D ubiquinol oxidase subunit II [Planctomycetota bacterium]
MSSSEEAFHEDPAVADAIAALLAQVPADAGNRDLIGKMLGQVMQLPSEPLTRGELKLLEKSMRDFRAAFTGFAGHRERKKISIFGSARSPEGSPIYAHCQEFSRAAVERGYMVITGAGPGIMQAGNQGAGREHSFGVSIDLPFEASANPYIDSDPKHVHFKYFFSRKLSFVKESDAIVLYPGGFGTMDEGFESLTLLQTGKCDPLPVILMDVPGGSYWPSWERYVRENLLGRGLISDYDRNLYRFTSNVEQALSEVELFYRCYHSLRYVGNFTILRLKQQPSVELLARLNERYGDLLAEGKFELMSGPHDAERNEPEAVRALPRIGFRFIQRRYGRLRRLIDEINLSASKEAEPHAVDPPHGSGALELPAPE